MLLSVTKQHLTIQKKHIDVFIEALKQELA